MQKFSQRFDCHVHDIDGGPDHSSHLLSGGNVILKSEVSIVNCNLKREDYQYAVVDLHKQLQPNCYLPLAVFTNMCGAVKQVKTKVVAIDCYTDGVEFRCSTDLIKKFGGYRTGMGMMGIGGGLFLGGNNDGISNGVANTTSLNTPQTPYFPLPYYTTNQSTNVTQYTPATRSIIIIGISIGIGINIGTSIGIRSSHSSFPSLSFFSS